MADTKQGRGSRRPAAPAAPTGKGRPSSGPEIAITQSPMGRATLEDVQDEIRAAPWPRAPLMTVSYNDLPLDGKRRKEARAAMPELVMPPPMPRRPMTSAPEIELGEQRLGRETLALLNEGLPEDEIDSERMVCDALELRTFVVPTSHLSPRATDAEKREFLRNRLAHRLPCSPSNVRRVDARVLEPGAVVLRVWCPVD